MAQLVASMSGVVLGGVVEVTGSNLARGKLFTASIGSVVVSAVSLSILIQYIPLYIHIYICPSIFSSLSFNYFCLYQRSSCNITQ